MHIHRKIDAVTLIKLRRIISRNFLLIIFLKFFFMVLLLISIKIKIIIESNKQI